MLIDDALDFVERMGIGKALIREYEPQAIQGGYDYLVTSLTEDDDSGEE